MGGIFEADIEVFRDSYIRELDRRLQVLTEDLNKKGSIVPKSPSWSYALFILINIVLCVLGVVVWYYPTMTIGSFAMLLVYLALPIYVALHERWERKVFREW